MKTLSSNGAWGPRPHIFSFSLSLLAPKGAARKRETGRLGASGLKPRYSTAFLLAFLPLQLHAAAVTQGTHPWPNATVTYHFDQALLNAVGTQGQDCTGWAKWRAAAAAFKACKAMNAWHAATGVTFTAGASFDALQIVAGDSTDATLGHLPFGNRLRIETGVTYGSVLHEFGHVLGLMHEHQRPDRDQYLTLEPFLKTYLDTCGLKLNAVCNDVRIAFPVVKTQLSSDYDPCSLMHYLANQAPRHREDPRWSRIFTLTDKGLAALKICLPQFAKLEPRCRKVGQKCAISQSDAFIVRRFHHLN